MDSSIEKVLLVLFYLFSLIAVICYFVFSEDRTYFYYSGGAAIVMRGVHYIMKYLM
ncbi:MAG: hypothetical protein ACK5JU_08790 [Bacteroidales bacterium]